MRRKAFLSGNGSASHADGVAEKQNTPSRRCPGRCRLDGACPRPHTSVERLNALCSFPFHAVIGAERRGMQAEAISMCIQTIYANPNF